MAGKAISAATAEVGDTLPFPLMEERNVSLPDDFGGASSNGEIGIRSGDDRSTLVILI